MTTLDKSLSNIRVTRGNFLKLINDCSLDALNEVPPGFNNNILWNFGHIIASQQILCYQLSNTVLILNESLISKYRKGTKPESFIGSEELQALKSHLLSTIDQLEKDFENGVLENYNSTTTSFGVALTSIQDAITYLPVHDGLHLGYALALKRMVTK